jgi:hypothetical protein
VWLAGPALDTNWFLGSVVLLLGFLVAALVRLLGQIWRYR